MTTEVSASTLFALVSFWLVNALPAQSYPNWATIKGENGNDLQYNLNTLKSLPNDIKRVDVYQPTIESADVFYISCKSWKFAVDGAAAWKILAPNTKIEALAYKLCPNRSTLEKSEKQKSIVNKKDGGYLKDPNEYLGDGNARSKLGDKIGAIADYTLAISINPKFAKAYYNRGNAKYALGDKKGAITDYSNAVAISPQFADAYNNRGRVKDSLGDKRGAIEDYNQAITINPNDDTYFFNRGKAKDDFDKKGAISDYSQAIAINPSDPDAFNNRGNIKADLGDKQGACIDYKKSVSLGNKWRFEWLQGKDGAWCRNTP